MEKFLLISTGAVFGANARYWLNDWFTQKWGSGFPIGTLVINISGSLLVGFLVTLATDRLMIDPRWRLLFVVGFLGAYTTFSTYTYESFNLIMNGDWRAGLVNMFGSVVAGVLSVGVGIFLAKSL